jgi:hypothetical protein
VSSHARSASVGQWMVKADTQPSRAPARPGLGVLRHTWGTKQHQEAPRALLGASGRRAGHAHLPCRTGQDSAAAGPATGRFTWQKAGFACCMLGRRRPPGPGRPGRSTHSTQQQSGGVPGVWQLGGLQLLQRDSCSTQKLEFGRQGEHQ